LVLLKKLFSGELEGIEHERDKRGREDGRKRCHATPMSKNLR